jgi:hypothetical protein
MTELITPNQPQSKDKEGWQPYDLDYYAQELVLDYRDKKNVLNESHKMRMTIAYGLERFWGEHLRLLRENKEEQRNKGKYWQAVWDKLEFILKKGGVNLPNHSVDPNNTQQIKDMAKALWKMPLPEQRVALMVLTQLCDSIVWWTQRYKKSSSD